MEEAWTFVRGSYVCSEHRYFVQIYPPSTKPPCRSYGASVGEDDKSPQLFTSFWPTRSLRPRKEDDHIVAVCYLFGSGAAA